MARGKTAGNKGQGSKWITRERRAAIYARDGRRCCWCGNIVCTQPDCNCIGRATLDHVVSRAAGGSNKSDNLITACMRCNRLRGDKTAEAFARSIGRRILAAIKKSTRT